MPPSKIVHRPAIVGEELELTDEERWLLPPSVVRQYRAYEAIELQRFNGTWKLHRIPIDENYHDKAKPWIDKPLGDPKREAELDKLDKEYNDLITKHNNKKAVAWEPVLKNLKRQKAYLLAQFLASLKTQQAIESDYRIPQQGRWITFPLCNIEEDSDKYNGEPVTITWKSANTTFNATYYKTTCWFGELIYDQVLVEDPVETNQDSIRDTTSEAAPETEQKGTKVSADKKAQEATQDRSASQDQIPEASQKTYPRAKLDLKKPSDKDAREPPATSADNPGLTDKTASAAGSGQRWKASIRLDPFGETELFIAAEFIEQRYQGAPHLRGLHLRDNSPPGTKWAYLRLDNSFHYGQNFDPPQYRYLVYHPFIRDRDIPQRAFADNVMFDTADSMASSAASSSNDYLATGGNVAGGLLKIVRSLAGHSLRRFDPLEGDQRLYNVPQEMAKWEAKWNAEARSIPAHLKEFNAGVQVVATDQKLAQSLEESAREETLEEAEETIEQIAEIVQEQAGKPDPEKRARYQRPFIIKTGGWHRRVAVSIEKQLVAEGQRDQRDTHPGDANYSGRPDRMLDAGNKDVRQRITNGTVNNNFPANMNRRKKNDSGS